VKAWILIIGDEVLDGFVDDANAACIARRLHDAGIELARILVLPDDTGTIAEEIRRAMAGPRPSVVFTCGGIGGTWDDVTYSGIAAAMGTGLELDPALAASVQEVIDWTGRAGYRLDEDAIEGMRRIATVPAGSVVHTAGDWLACVRFDVDGGVAAPDGCTVVALPGPPGHVRKLVDDVVLPDILGGRKGNFEVVDVEHNYPETLLVGELARIRGRHPDIRSGSYPGEPMLVRFTGARREVRAAEEELREFLRELDEHPSAGRIKTAWTKQESWSAEEGD
jgi:molybdenum cofactor synthesis domain-containing protein